MSHCRSCSCTHHTINEACATYALQGEATVESSLHKLLSGIVCLGLPSQRIRLFVCSPPLDKSPRNTSAATLFRFPIHRSVKPPCSNFLSIVIVIYCCYPFVIRKLAFTSAASRQFVACCSSFHQREGSWASMVRSSASDIINWYYGWCRLLMSFNTTPYWLAQLNL